MGSMGKRRGGKKKKGKGERGGNLFLSVRAHLSPRFTTQRVKAERERGRGGAAFFEEGKKSSRTRWPGNGEGEGRGGDFHFSKFKGGKEGKHRAPGRVR